ncbi:MAG: lipid II flippase MurJ [Frankiaceae bacterium]
MGIAVVTVLARALGFGRVVVFAHTVGAGTCLGSAYYTANMVPNIVFEVVAGGALASLVVPVLAGSVERADRDAVAQVSGALLGWSLLILLPLAIAVAALARPVLDLLYAPRTGGCDVDAVVALGSRMLAVFAPQVVLYGVAVVLTGVLQAHRRFVGPALAPVLSSLVVIAGYLLYGVLSAGRSQDPGTLSTARELSLSVGTTLGVLALAAPLLVPLRRTGLRLRPGLRFPPGLATRVRRLAYAGAAVLIAQQVSVVVVVRLADSYAPRGGLVIYTLAWTLFLLPWSVLAVPIATSAFPALAARADAGDRRGFAELAAGSTRAVMLLSGAAAALLAAAAAPAARVLIAGTRGDPDPTELAAAIVAFAPGLVGYGLVASLGRALYARGSGRAAALATVMGWLGVGIADVLLVPSAGPGRVVAALGLANSLGMTLAGLLLVAAVHRAAGAEAVAGVARTAAAAVAGALVGGLAGWAAARGVTTAWGAGLPANLAAGAVAAAAVSVAFAAVVGLLDTGSLAAVRDRRFIGA